MYRLNESILVNDESGDDMEIPQKIFSTNISGKCYGFICAALYSQSISDTGESLYHLYSDSPYVGTVLSNTFNSLLGFSMHLSDQKNDHYSSIGH